MSDLNEPSQNTKEARRLAQAVDGDWHRVHPISPFVRGWIVFVAILFVLLQNMGEDVVNGLRGSEDTNLMPLLIAGGIAVGVLLIIVIGFFISWAFYKFRITEEMVQIHSGFIFRKQRHVRLDRVQAVDIKRPVLARIFGLAQLDFEAADAGDTAMSLAFIRHGEAAQLRAEIMRRAAFAQAPEAAATGPANPAGVGDSASPTGSAGPVDPAVHQGSQGAQGPAQQAPGADHGVIPGMDPDPEDVMLKLPTKRLIGSIAFSSLLPTAILFGVVLAGLIWGISLLDDEDSGPGFILFVVIIPVVVPILVGVWSQFSRNYGFTVARSSDGLRLRYGLLETGQQTVPPGRVQAIGIHQGFFWRWFGWYKIQVNVAGYGADTSGKTTILPVGTFDDVLRVLTVVAPNPGVDNAQELIETSLTGTGEEHGFTNSPRRVWWLDPISWKRTGFAVTPTMVLLRSGRLNRKTVLMSHERIQSLNLSQGPLERMSSVANLHLHTPVGPVTPKAKHLDVSVAEQLFSHESSIAAVSRRMSDRNQWMRPEEINRFNQQTAQARKTLGDPENAYVAGASGDPTVSGTSETPATTKTEGPE